MTAEDLHSYYCEDCEEWTYIDELNHPGNIYCAHCGEANVNISAKDYELLRYARSKVFE
ncbi:hypothetical protein G3M80_03090 [Bacillus altitudinis]|uniref:hypothetical protein n=1 Tax=Bacillus altitudinis TaxID=293387 RepID=UPI0013EE5E13|nr:hypothetical protein [Bacillus altitudinis]QII23602.1 hypothetical protein G3M80_03090 [Bacillus altitudinis]